MANPHPSPTSQMNGGGVSGCCGTIGASSNWICDILTSVRQILQRFGGSKLLRRRFVFFALLVTSQQEEFITRVGGRSGFHFGARLQPGLANLIDFVLEEPHGCGCQVGSQREHFGDEP